MHQLASLLVPDEVVNGFPLDHFGVTPCFFVEYSRSHFISPMETARP
jgi:hypothetical protein